MCLVPFRYALPDPHSDGEEVGLHGWGERGCGDAAVLSLELLGMGSRVGAGAAVPCGPLVDAKEGGDGLLVVDTFVAMSQEGIVGGASGHCLSRRPRRNGKILQPGFLATREGVVDEGDRGPWSGSWKRSL
jgi:hypothetical protein